MFSLNVSNWASWTPWMDGDSAYNATTINSRLTIDRHDDAEDPPNGPDLGRRITFKK